jgi:hypothetical protein
LEPATVVTPATSNRFFTAKGTPASSSFDLSLASTFLACARARSAVTVVKAFSVGLVFAMRAKAASVTADAVVLPEATALAMSAEFAQSRSSAIGQAL